MVPVPFKVQKWFCMYFIRKSNSSWYQVSGVKYMGGLSGLSRSPEKIVNTNQNTSLVRVIYIITMLEFCCSKSCVRWNLTNAPESQSLSPVARYFLVHLPPYFTCQWDATEALPEATTKKFISEYPIHSYLEGSLRPLAGNFSLHIIQVLPSNSALQ